jgi:hypothetical protein
MTYKIYGECGEMEIYYHHQKEKTIIEINDEFIELNEFDIQDLIEVLNKFKNKESKWIHLSSN